jgi:polar amino acid transport system permease protein/octopine/nopaline transport system permease protein
MFDYNLMMESLPELLSGALLTLEMLIICLTFGVFLAVPMAIMRVNKNPWISSPIAWYIFFFRSTPLLAQLFFVYYGFSQFEAVRESWVWIFLKEPYFCALLTLTLHTSAYTANILRGGIQTIPVGEIEAARAIGMSRWRLYRRIILPCALRKVIPPYGNEVIGMMKGTALVSTVTLMDLTGVAGVLTAESFATIELYLVVAAIYLSIGFVLTKIFQQLETRATRHMRPITT